jgi:hypothetical protein
MNTIVLNSSEIFAEGIRLISRPLDTDAGVCPLTPFVLSVSAETGNYEDLVIDVYANNSKSIPFTSELDNNWSYLKPQWRFLDSDKTPVDEYINIDYVDEIIDEDGNVRGGVGTATFYYMDDIANDYGEPVMLQVRLNTLDYYDKDAGDGIISFYNSTMKLAIPFQVYPVKPSFIHFSQNGNTDLYNIQWVGTPIYSYATINGIPRSKFLDYDACAVDYPIIFDLPKYPSSSNTNILTYKVAPLSNQEMGVSATPSAEFLPFEMDSGVANGGWVALESSTYVECSSAMLSGSVNIKIDPDDYYSSSTSEMWVSNRTANTIHKLENMYIDTSIPEVEEFYEHEGSNISNNVYTMQFSTPFYDPAYYDSITDSDILSNTMELSGYSGVYGMAIDGHDNVWNVDYELDRIYKRNSAGEILFTVDLQLLNKGVDIGLPYADDEYTWYGPSSISLDGDGSAYVSLYNTPSAMKISSDGNIEGYMVPSFAPTSVYPVSGEESSYVRPIDIETTVDGDVIVLYSNDELSAIARFEDMVDVGGSWVSSTDGYPFDMVYRRSSNGDDYIFCSIKGRIGTGDADSGIYSFLWDSGSNAFVGSRLNKCIDPKYITLDDSDNIWFSYDDNRIGMIPKDTLTDIDTNFINFSIPYSGEISDVIGGIACDDSGFINVIQTYSNIIYRQNVLDFINNGSADLYGIKITPDENYTIIKNDAGEIVKVYAEDGDAVSSLQSYGDWCGTGWRKKFSESSNINLPIIVNLRGSSTLFELKSFNDAYELRRENDSWDMSAQIKSYVIPEYQREFVNLWDDLIGSIVGDSVSDYQTIGRQFYEKIANFVLNHSDIDLSNIDQVYSQFKSLALDYDNYDFKYPADLKHWMNILSIVFERLRGSKCKCNRNFKTLERAKYDKCAICGNVHDSNMGDMIINPVMVTNETVIIRDLFNSHDGFDIFHPPIDGDYTQLEDYGYRSPFFENYEIYEYIPTVGDNIQSAGFINMSDPNNSIQLSGVDLDDWWGDGGYVEQIFTHTLFDGLGVAVDYITNEKAHELLDIEIISTLPDDTVLVVNGNTTSEYILPLQYKLCSPITQHGLPFYSLSGNISSPSIPIKSDIIKIINGLVVSGKYLEIFIGDRRYYAPTYKIDTQVLPVVGDGMLFDSDIVDVVGTLVSAGYLVFDNNGDTILLPVYE